MFKVRFSPSVAPSPTLRTTRPAYGKTLVGVGLLLLVGWGLLHWIAGARRSNGDGLPADTGPVLIAMQSIGQLHTVTYQMKDVLRQETQHDPEGWLSNVPGAAGLVHWATHNEALLMVDGSVDAGVDLSHLTDKDVTITRRPDGTTVRTVHLPPVTLYPPVIHVRVVHSEDGPFWRDENIVPKAQERASQQFLAAAEQSGIRAKAQANAIQQLQAMERALGRKDVEFTF
jgi:hypothetical protein